MSESSAPYTWLQGDVRQTSTVAFAVTHRMQSPDSLSPLFCGQHAVSSHLEEGITVYSVNTQRDDGGKDGRVCAGMGSGISLLVLFMFMFVLMRC